MTQPLTWSRTPIPEMDFGLSIQESHGFSRVECQIKEGVSLLQAALVLVTFGIISAVVILALRFQIGSATLVKRRKQRFLRKINGVWKVELK